MIAIYIYFGGALSLLLESLVQMLHKDESLVHEKWWEAVLAAVIWPLMGLMVMIELVLSLFVRSR